MQSQGHDGIHVPQRIKEFSNGYEQGGSSYANFSDIRSVHQQLAASIHVGNEHLSSSLVGVKNRMNEIAAMIIQPVPTIIPNLMPSLSPGMPPTTQISAWGVHLHRVLAPAVYPSAPSNYNTFKR